MWRLLVTVLLLACGGATHAGQFSQETEAGYSYVGGADTKLGGGRSGDVSEQRSVARYVISPELKSGALLRFGADWERFSFGLPEGAPLPNTLESVSIVAGIDVEIFESWIVRLEAQPGFYGNASHLRGQDLNVPIILGGSYFLGSDVQIIVGLSIDVNRQYPVLPGLGVRWKFAERWVLNAIPPRPRLEYLFSDTVTGYAGIQLLGGTYRVDGRFGSSHDDPRLNSAVVDYAEVRAGAGAWWKVADVVTLEAEAGYMPYRDFDFHRAGPERRTQGGAAYGQVALSAKF